MSALALAWLVGQSFLPWVIDFKFVCNSVDQCKTGMMEIDHSYQICQEHRVRAFSYFPKNNLESILVSLL